MLTASLSTMCVFLEQLRIGAHLVSDKSQHGCWRYFRWIQQAAGVTKGAELDCKAQAITRAAPGPHERQVPGAEHIVFGHLSRVDGNTEQARALLGGKQGSAGQGTSNSRGRPFIKRLPFTAILKQDCESRFLWKTDASQSDAQTIVCESRQGHAARLRPRLQGRRAKQQGPGQDRKS